MAPGVQLEDTVTITTPEGVEVELRLAGLGSRFIAGVTDLIIQELLSVAIGVLTGVAGGSDGLNAAAFLISSFVIVFAYPILFEVLGSGRTPGKRLTHLRVLRDSAAPVDLPASAIRNLMRLLDGPLLGYVPTIISVLVTRRNQRPGDLAGGTLVVRDAPPASSAVRRRRRPGRRRAAGRARAQESSPGASADWDVSAITVPELTAVRRFLARRDSLAPAPREDLASRLAHGLKTKVGGAPEEIGDERFLETLAATKAGARRS